MPACSALTSRTINALRFPCAVLVVLIHLFKPVPEETFPFGFFRTLEIAVSDGVARIAVPIFFFISGYLFFSKLQKWDWGAYSLKIKKRIKTLLVPYLLWVTLAILFDFSLALVRNRFFGWGSPWNLFSSNGWGLMYWNCARNRLYTSEMNLLGWTMHSAFPYDYPLWFIRDLIVLCLFAPVIHYAIRKTKGWGIAVLYALYLLEIWIPWEGFSAEGWFFFALGTYLQINGKDPTTVFSRFKVPSYLLFVLALVLCIRMHENPIAWGYARRFLALPGTIAAFSICSSLLDKSILKDHPFLAECSFPIFAGHAIGLMFLTELLANKIIPGTGEAILFWQYLFRLLLIIAIILITYRWAKRLFPKAMALFTGNRS